MCTASMRFTLFPLADVITLSVADLSCLFPSMICVYAGLGYLGAAMATSISLWLQFFTLLIYIVFLKVCRLGMNCAASLHGCQTQNLQHMVLSFHGLQAFT